MVSEGMRAAFLVMIAAVTMTSACGAPLRVGAHVQSDVAHVRYTSFSFDETDHGEPAGASRLDANPLFEQRLHGAIQWELATRGIRLGGDGPALTAHHHVDVHDAVEIVDIHREGGLESWDDDGWWSTVEYRETTFVIGIADAETGQIVWRGWAHLGAEVDLDDPDRMRTRIDDAVARMFERFPVPRRR